MGRLRSRCSKIIPVKLRSWRSYLHWDVHTSMFNTKIDLAHRQVKWWAEQSVIQFNKQSTTWQVINGQQRGWHTLFPDSAAAAVAQSWTLCTAFLGHKVQFAFFLHGIKLINPHWRWLTYVRKKRKKGGFLLECSYREMEWKSCNGRLIPNFPVKTFHFLPSEIRTCSHAEPGQAEGGLLGQGDKLETGRVREMGGAVRCNLQAWGDHWNEVLHCQRKYEQIHCVLWSAQEYFQIGPYCAITPDQSLKSHWAHSSCPLDFRKAKDCVNISETLLCLPGFYDWGKQWSIEKGFSGMTSCETSMSERF